MSHDIVFSRFTAALGDLMTTGLNKLADGPKTTLDAALGDGGKVVCITTLDPLAAFAVLSYRGQEIELFRVTSEEITH